METQRMRHVLSIGSPFNPAYPRPFTLDQAQVFMSIGRWSKWWVPRTGSGIRRDCDAYVWKTTFAWMRFELAILLVFYELPEPTTERAGTPL